MKREPCKFCWFSINVNLKKTKLSNFLNAVLWHMNIYEMGISVSM